jgi:DNA-binding transcriptional ArsR family regulator
MSFSNPLDRRLLKALAHPLRERILESITDRGEASPVELARELDQPLAT